MIHDRPYMTQRSYHSGTASLLKWVLLINCVVFVLQNAFFVWFNSPILSNLFGLSPETLSQGFVWTLFTYAFLHGDLLHILFNMLIVYFIGQAVESLVGPKRFAIIYTTAALVGGLVWLLISMQRPSTELIGASAAALGLLTYFCCSQPNQPITVLLFFVLPLTIKPKWLALGLLAMELFGFLFYELPGRSAIANSAHLGGMLGGYLCFLAFQSGYSFSLFGSGTRISAPKWLQHRGKAPLSKQPFNVNVSSRQVLRTEVDRILDKINSKGFGALSNEEKKILEQAKDILK
tara:strand:- start:14011 stop:14883 length:873 start_codon:yes stop_codon:yes gene_type:complete